MTKGCGHIVFRSRTARQAVLHVLQPALSNAVLRPRIRPPRMGGWFKNEHRLEAVWHIPKAAAEANLCGFENSPPVRAPDQNQHASCRRRSGLASSTSILDINNRNNLNDSNVRLNLSGNSVHRVMLVPATSNGSPDVNGKVPDREDNRAKGRHPETCDARQCLA